jgi:hypothetical protein
LGGVSSEERERGAGDYELLEEVEEEEESNTTDDGLLPSRT